MNRIATIWKHRFGLLAIVSLALSATALSAQSTTNKKTTTPPPKPAAAPPARPAPSNAPHPGGSSGPASTANHPATGPTISNTTAGHPATGPSGSPTTTRSTTSTVGSGRPANAPNVAHSMNNTRPVPRGVQQTSLRSGNTLARRPNGGIRDVHDERRGINIHNGLNGSRHISVERADHSRIYAERGRPGYIQRGYVYRGHDFERRAYFYHGRSYNRFYRGYEYRPGLRLSIYAPYHYYGVGFYGWAYNPWYSPIYYQWGWAGNPWYGYYGGYFTPYPSYANASFWLTDYIISQDLAAEYQAQQEARLLAAAPPAGAAQLTPEVKQMIADEVRGQIALENAEAQQNAGGQDTAPASSSIARLLSDGHPHVFIAGGSLDLVDASGAECAVSDGDALELTSPPPADSPVAQLIVLASKGGNECHRSDSVNVALTDLQEMQNHMRERIDQGLEELQAKQGQSGLPAAPPSAMGKPVDAAFAQQAPPPEANGAADINQQLAAADQSQQEVVAQAQKEAGPSAGATDAPPPPPPAPAGPPPTVALGQTIDQVTAAFGQPTSVIDLGVKKVYNYPGMKVTFKSGKVSDVQ